MGDQDVKHGNDEPLNTNARENIQKPQVSLNTSLLCQDPSQEGVATKQSNHLKELVGNAKNREITTTLEVVCKNSNVAPYTLALLVIEVGDKMIDFNPFDHIPKEKQVDVIKVINHKHDMSVSVKIEKNTLYSWIAAVEAKNDKSHLKDIKKAAESLGFSEKRYEEYKVTTLCKKLGECQDVNEYKTILNNIPDQMVYNAVEKGIPSGAVACILNTLEEIKPEHNASKSGEIDSTRYNAAQKQKEKLHRYLINNHDSNNIIEINKLCNNDAKQAFLKSVQEESNSVILGNNKAAQVLSVIQPKTIVQPQEVQQVTNITQESWKSATDERKTDMLSLIGDEEGKEIFSKWETNPKILAQVALKFDSVELNPFDHIPKEKQVDVMLEIINIQRGRAKSKNQDQEQWKFEGKDTAKKWIDGMVQSGVELDQVRRMIGKLSPQEMAGIWNTIDKPIEGFDYMPEMYSLKDKVTSQHKAKRLEEAIKLTTSAQAKAQILNKEGKGIKSTWRAEALTAGMSGYATAGLALAAGVSGFATVGASWAILGSVGVTAGAIFTAIENNKKNDLKKHCNALIEQEKINFAGEEKFYKDDSKREMEIRKNGVKNELQKRIEKNTNELKEINDEGQKLLSGSGKTFQELVNMKPSEYNSYIESLSNKDNTMLDNIKMLCSQKNDLDTRNSSMENALKGFDGISDDIEMQLKTEIAILVIKNEDMAVTLQNKIWENTNKLQDLEKQSYVQGERFNIDNDLAREYQDLAREYHDLAQKYKTNRNEQNVTAIQENMFKINTVLADARKNMPKSQLADVFLAFGDNTKAKQIFMREIAKGKSDKDDLMSAFEMFALDPRISGKDIATALSGATTIKQQELDNMVVALANTGKLQDFYNYIDTETTQMKILTKEIGDSAMRAAETIMFDKGTALHRNVLRGIAKATMDNNISYDTVKNTEKPSMFLVMCVTFQDKAVKYFNEHKDDLAAQADMIAHASPDFLKAMDGYSGLGRDEKKHEQWKKILLMIVADLIQKGDKERLVKVLAKLDPERIAKLAIQLDQSGIEIKSGKQKINIFDCIYGKVSNDLKYSEKERDATRLAVIEKVIDIKRKEAKKGEAKDQEAWKFENAETTKIMVDSLKGDKMQQARIIGKLSPYEMSELWKVVKKNNSSQLDDYMPKFITEAGYSNSKKFERIKSAMERCGEVPEVQAAVINKLMASWIDGTFHTSHFSSKDEVKKLCELLIPDAKSDKGLDTMIQQVDGEIKKLTGSLGELAKDHEKNRKNESLEIGKSLDALRQEQKSLERAKDQADRAGNVYANLSADARKVFLKTAMKRGVVEQIISNPNVTGQHIAEGISNSIIDKDLLYIIQQLQKKGKNGEVLGWNDKSAELKSFFDTFKENKAMQVRILKQAQKSGIKETDLNLISTALGKDKARECFNDMAHKCINQDGVTQDSLNAETSTVQIEEVVGQLIKMIIEANADTLKNISGYAKTIKYDNDKTQHALFMSIMEAVVAHLAQDLNVNQEQLNTLIKNLAENSPLTEKELGTLCAIVFKKEQATTNNLGEEADKVTTTIFESIPDGAKRDKVMYKAAKHDNLFPAANIAYVLSSLANVTTSNSAGTESTFETRARHSKAQELQAKLHTHLMSHENLVEIFQQCDPKVQQAFLANIMEKTSYSLTPGMLKTESSKQADTALASLVNGLDPETLANAVTPNTDLTKIFELLKNSTRAKDLEGNVNQLKRDESYYAGQLKSGLNASGEELLEEDKSKVQKQLEETQKQLEETQKQLEETQKTHPLQAFYNALGKDKKFDDTKVIEQAKKAGVTVDQLKSEDINKLAKRDPKAAIAKFNAQGYVKDKLAIFKGADTQTLKILDGQGGMMSDPTKAQHKMFKNLLKDVVRYIATEWRDEASEYKEVFKNLDAHQIAKLIISIDKDYNNDLDMKGVFDAINTDADKDKLGKVLKEIVAYRNAGVKGYELQNSSIVSGMMSKMVTEGGLAIYGMKPNDLSAQELYGYMAAQQKIKQDIEEKTKTLEEMKNNLLDKKQKQSADDKEKVEELNEKLEENQLLLLQVEMGVENDQARTKEEIESEIKTLKEQINLTEGEINDLKAKDISMPSVDSKSVEKMSKAADLAIDGITRSLVNTTKEEKKAENDINVKIIAGIIDHIDTNTPKKSTHLIDYSAFSAKRDEIIKNTINTLVEAKKHDELAQIYQNCKNPKSKQKFLQQLVQEGKHAVLRKLPGQDLAAGLKYAGGEKIAANILADVVKSCMKSERQTLIQELYQGIEDNKTLKARLVLQIMHESMENTITGEAKASASLQAFAQEHFRDVVVVLQDTKMDQAKFFKQYGIDAKSIPAMIVSMGGMQISEEEEFGFSFAPDEDVYQALQAQAQAQAQAKGLTQFIGYLHDSSDRKAAIDAVIAIDKGDDVTQQTALLKYWLNPTKGSIQGLIKNSDIVHMLEKMKFSEVIGKLDQAEAAKLLMILKNETVLFPHLKAVKDELKKHISKQNVDLAEVYNAAQGMQDTINKKKLNPLYGGDAAADKAARMVAKRYMALDKSEDKVGAYSTLIKTKEGKKVAKKLLAKLNTEERMQLCKAVYTSKEQDQGDYEPILFSALNEKEQTQFLKNIYRGEKNDNGIRVLDDDGDHTKVKKAAMFLYNALTMTDNAMHISSSDILKKVAGKDKGTQKDLLKFICQARMEDTNTKDNPDMQNLQHLIEHNKGYVLDIYKDLACMDNFASKDNVASVSGAIYSAIINDYKVCKDLLSTLAVRLIDKDQENKEKSYQTFINEALKKNPVHESTVKMFKSHDIDKAQRQYMFDQAVQNNKVDFLLSINKLDKTDRKKDSHKASFIQLCTLDNIVKIQNMKVEDKQQDMQKLMSKMVEKLALNEQAKGLSAILNGNDDKVKIEDKAKHAELLVALVINDKIKLKYGDMQCIAQFVLDNSNCSEKLKEALMDKYPVMYGQALGGIYTEAIKYPETQKAAAAAAAEITNVAKKLNEKTGEGKFFKDIDNVDNIIKKFNDYSKHNKVGRVMISTQHALFKSSKKKENDGTVVKSILPYIFERRGEDR